MVMPLAGSQVSGAVAENTGHYQELVLDTSLEVSVRHFSESRCLWLEHAGWFLVEKRDLGVLTMQRIRRITLTETT